jgi:hypothetical protein
VRGKPDFHPSFYCCSCFCSCEFTFASAILELGALLA